MIDARLTKALISILFLFAGTSFGRSVSLSAEAVFDAYKNATRQSLLRREKVALRAEETRSDKIPARYGVPTEVMVHKWSIFRDGVRLHSRRETFEDGRITQKREYLLDDEHGFTVTHGVPPFWLYEYTKDRVGMALNSLSSLARASAGYIPGDAMKPLWEVMEGTSAGLKLRENVEVVDGHETYVLEVKTPNLGHCTLWIDYNCGFNLRRYVVRKTGSDLLWHRPLNTPPPPPDRERPDRPLIYSLPTSEHTDILDSVRIEKIGGRFVPVEGRIVSRRIYSNGEERIIERTVKRSEIDLNPDFDNYENAFDIGVPDGTRVVSRDHGVGVRFIWLNGKMVADVDDLVIAELDKTAQQIMADGDVPIKLGSFANTHTPDEEPSAVADTHTEVAESESEVLAESHGLSVVVLILIGLPVIGVVGLLVFRKLKA